MSKSAPSAVRLSATARRFVREWGELGERWGFDRATAEVHGLLFAVGEPLSAQELASTLQIDPGEAAAAAERLVTMQVAKSAAGADGSRRFQGVTDVLEMLRAILEEKRRRELEPPLAVLRDTVLRADSDPDADPAMVRRMEELQDVLRLSVGFYKAVGTMPAEPTKRMLKLGQKIRQSLGG